MWVARWQERQRAVTQQGARWAGIGGNTKINVEDNVPWSLPQGISGRHVDQVRARVGAIFILGVVGQEEQGRTLQSAILVFAE